MAISVLPNSVKINILSIPIARPAEIFKLLGDNYVKVELSPFKIEGSVDVTNNSEDSGQGHTLGFIQVLLKNTSWVHYRGLKNNDGSVLKKTNMNIPNEICRDTWPANANGMWMDKPKNYTITNTPKVGTVIPMKALYFDQPFTRYFDSTTNSLTGKINYIREIQVEKCFCTILALRWRELAGPFTVLTHFYWSAIWQYRFNLFDYDSMRWSIEPVKGGNSSHIGKPINGPVTDPKIASMLFDTNNSSSCNTLSNKALKNPVIEESKIWSNFNVNR